MMKLYSGRALDKITAVFNYRVSRASKWRALDSAIRTKVDPSMENVMCIALVHSIVIGVEISHESLSSNECDSLDTNHSTQFKQPCTVQLVHCHGRKRLFEK